MKDKKIITTDSTKVEKILKNKMNELSDSVDCFDRISAQVFAEEKFGISDDDFTVSGLENITGRSNVPKILKWTATAVVAAICIAVIPHNNFVRRMFSKVTDGENKFPVIMEELETELESGAYIYIDVPLNYYIENDVLVTPLFCCPFEDCEKENANVRLFTKQIDGIETTQMYAVLYDGIYTEKNIIAAAESKYKFTAEDMTYTLNEDIKFANYAETAAEMSFGSDKNGEILDSEGNQVSVASFTNNVLVKNAQNEIVNQSSEILFGHKNDSEYFYDILTYNNENFSRDKFWKNSVYFNGNSSYPKTSESKFTRTDIFNSLKNTTNTQNDFSFIRPIINSSVDNQTTNGTNYVSFENDFHIYNYNNIYNYGNNDILGIIPVPANIQARLTIKIYFSVTNDDMEILLTSTSNMPNTIFDINELSEIHEQEEAYQKELQNWFNILLEAEHERIRFEEEKTIKEIEENKKEIEEALKKQEIEKITTNTNP